MSYDSQNTPTDEPGESLPEIDEGPPPAPVDEIQAAIFEALQAGARAEVEFDELTATLAPDIGPAAPDAVEQALAEASQAGLPTNVEFDRLPAPTGPLEPLPPPPAAEPVPVPIPAVAPPPPPPPDPAPIFAAPPDVALILALFAAFRLLSLFLLRPGGFLRDWSDFDTYFGIASLSDYGLYPFLHFWLEWPPLVPWLAVGAYRLSLTMLPWSDDPRLWFVLILGSVFLLFEIGNFLLLARLSRRLHDNPATTSRVLWIYALLFPPLYAMLGYFDGVALFFILLALEWLLAEKRSLSAVAVGIGIVVKIFPVLVVPVAARRLWQQYRRQEAGIEIGLYGVTCGLTVLALLAPFLWGGPQWLLASFRAMAGRSSWETVWAVLEGYSGFGVVLGNRLNPAETNFAAHPGLLPGWLIMTAFAALYLWLLTRPADYRQSRPVLALAGLTTITLLLANKGYSPQFLVYLLPFILLLMPNARGAIYALALTGLNVLEQPVYFVLLPSTTWLLAFTVTARLVVLLLIGLEFGLELWPGNAPQSALARAQRAIPQTLALLGGLALLVLLPVLAHAYNAAQLNSSPAGMFAQFMQTQLPADQPRPRLLLSDQATYRQLYPYLQPTLDLQLADGESRQLTGAATLSQLLAGQNRVWILPTGPQAQRLQNLVTQRGTELASYAIAGLGTASLYSFEKNPLPVIPPVRFIGGIELLAHHVETTPAAVNVTLYWRAREPQNQNLTVFTQLLDSSGKLVASHDSVPRNGTAPVTGWTAGAVQIDPHRIELPANFAPGDYTLLVGLYNDTTERVRGIDPTGFGFANRAVPLEVLRFQ